MGKKQHQKDKMYLTFTEWSTLYGGKRPKSMQQDNSEFQRLPYDHCALSLQPFENPYCDAHGNIFELTALVPFLKKFKVNPITGEKLDAKSLIKLNFTKDSDDKYHCPVLYKVFTANSHICAIRTTGNVFSFEAVEELNIKGKNWKELLTDEPITRNDIITLQDPRDLKKFNLADFHHVKNNLRILDEEIERAAYDPNARLKSTAPETRDAIDELNREYKPAKAEAAGPAKKEGNAAHFSTGAVAAGFTSTVMPIHTVHEAAIRYARIETSCGSINVELHCDKAPKACENFILLCKRGYYDGTKFHRSIKHFMIQGGDPTGTGTGGESAWSTPFDDEFRASLHHEGRGVLSMANSGPNTNKSQFFITFRSCKHLDGKHSVFGRVVGGLETLSEMEKIETDNKDKPIEDITFVSVQVFTDPFEELDEIIAAEKAKEVESVAEVKPKKSSEPLKVYREGVGKYINFKDAKRKLTEEPEATTSKLTKTKKKAAGYEFKNFSNW
ncbi:Peptidyl-prolyl cis-trans isomerase-like 2 [Orchesella cincta]|uniref:RING-type E3 ubiquitin-protein ligase PPIL2 n=1 Tax=Orchesella cincta TaxID=48709 RepID=A0A1D2NJN8_ORCCI|nr:Peptidyl-prolyl cis-trans isomerase-like 2 [Orchesella cincta]